MVETRVPEIKTGTSSPWVFNKPTVTKVTGKFRRHIVIPDTQCKPDVPMEHLEWAGRYIAEQNPDVVVHLGDHWDMPSLSSYDKGKKAFEGRRYKNDIIAGNAGMDLLMGPIAKMPRRPRMIFLIGNHEERIERVEQGTPELEGVIGYQDFNLRTHGWEIYPYRQPVNLDGILYAHYFYNVASGKPYTGRATSILPRVGQTFIQGHRQGLDASGDSTLATGQRRRGIIAGSFYQHREEYLGPQSNEWRGILVLNEVRDGNFDLMEVSLDYLRRRFG